MRIAIISPYSRGPMRGNITTVRRIVQALEAAGVETVISAVDGMPVEEMGCRLATFAPDMIHAFHAGYCGDSARQLAKRLKIPYIITITGSDINDPNFRQCTGMQRDLAAATAVVCFDDLVAAEVVKYFPGVAGRLSLIPQGVVPLPVKADEGLDLPEEAFILLLPAALRPVKNIEFPLRALAPLARLDRRLLFVIAGGVIDQGYAETVRVMLSGSPFARWLDEVPYEKMGALYARADLVLNCSHVEGMPNSLLEAMALARPILAADIPGNQSLVRENETGWLYRDEAGFRAQVIRLMGDAALRAEVGTRASEYAASHFSPRIEADSYINLYSTILSKAVATRCP